MTAPEKTPQAGRPKGVPDHNPLAHLTNDCHRGKPPVDSSIADTIEGQMAGAQFVRDLCEGIAAPDALYMRLREIADDAAMMRGFCRAAQKYIERGAF